MLKDLHLAPVYDSAEHDLIRDLIIPLLKNSLMYLRGVGFFTSGWLKLASAGLAELIEHGGFAQIILSPHMEKSDWEAFQLGEEAKHNLLLKDLLKKNLGEIVSSLEGDTLNTLAWMIADDILEFRFAIARDTSKGGDYHDKVAVFADQNNDMVAIHGSFNDSIKGSLNGEAFSVFKSWENGHRPFVDQHNKRLRQLWDNQNSQFKIYAIPEAIKHAFIKLRVSNRPYSIVQEPRIWFSDVNTIKTPPSINPHPYQEDALNSWLNAGQRGILEMATGTGKTITALTCAVHRYVAIRKMALVVLVPYLHLLEQWEVQCKLFGFQPILCSSNHEGWNIAVKSKVQDFNLGVIDNVCIIAVHATASTDRFAKSIAKLKPNQTLLIGDEVHNLGSPVLQKALIENADMRLGLSATPRRWLDDVGSKALFLYFGPVCFEFTLENAIGQYLTPYEYRPELVHLTVHEQERYEDLTNKIAKLQNVKDDSIETREQLKKLLLERARIIAQAQQKLPRLLSIFHDMLNGSFKDSSELHHILVYCAPGTHRKVLMALSGLGLRCREFVHYVSLLERERILEEFASGDIQVIVAVKCLDEGVDIPATRTAFILASTTNPKEFVQRRGRILRLAKGKEKAMIYDFIVIPNPEKLTFKRDVDASLLKREMPRFAEFSSVASNEFSARSKMWPILDNYELLNLFDEKPWEMYHEIRKNFDAVDFVE